MQVKIESIAVEERALLLFGYAYHPGEEVDFMIRSAKDDADYFIERSPRSEFTEERECGFKIRVEMPVEEEEFPVEVTFAAGEETQTETIPYERIVPLIRNKKGGPRALAEKAFSVLKEEGPGAFIKKASIKLGIPYIRAQHEYKKWMEQNDPTQDELISERMYPWEKTPLISIVVPVYRTDPKLLLKMIGSVRKQSYQRWELILADGSADGSLTELLDRCAARDARIRPITLKENKGISGNTNAGLEKASGDLIAFLDHDDELSPDALWQNVRAWVRDPDREMIYSDQDMISEDGKKRYDPMFKEDFSMEHLCRQNYICHFVVITKDLFEKVGFLSREFDGAQDYDYLFRCAEQAKKVHHIPRMLYHWRATRNSVAGNQSAKQYAFDAGARAINAHYRRTGENKIAVETEEHGVYETIEKS